MGWGYPAERAGASLLSGGVRGPIVALASAALALGLLAGCSSEDTSSPTPTGSVGGSAGTGGSTGGTGGTAGTGGAGVAGGATHTGQIIVDPDDPAWFAYEGGASYYLCGPGDPEGFLYRGTRNGDGTRDGDQMAIINALAPTGANSIYMVAVRSHGGDGGPTENPFIDSDPANGLDADILSQWEVWFTAMDQAGITTYLHVYDDDTNVWPTGDTVEAEEQAFIAAIVDQFEHHDHLIWSVAENATSVLSVQRISNIAAAIRAADDGNHPISVSEWGTLTFSFGDDPNVDQFSMQMATDITPAQLHGDMITQFEDAAGRYNLTLGGGAGYGSGATARAKSWVLALAGSYVMIQGQDIATTPVPDLEDCGRLREFMEATDLSGMAPHDELAWSETQWVLAVPGERYIAYASGPVTELGLATLPARTWNLSWFDIVTGTWEHETATTSGGGDAAFPKPVTMGDEVALYVR